MTKGSLTESQAYDRDGNVTSDSRSFPNVSGDPGTGTQSFTYDALNRVTGSSGLASGARTYTYDRDGNRRSKTEAGVTFTYTYDRTDQLISVQKGANATQSFTYDTFGNLTGDAQTGVSVTTSTYDLANRLTGIDTGGTATKTAFTLDALGRFRTRTVGTTSPAVDTYSYVGASEVVAQISTAAGGAPTITDSIVSPAGDRLGVKVGGTVNWLVPDLHGSIAGSLAFDEATLTHAIRYDAYGQTIDTGSAAGAPSPVGEKPWRYQGRLDVSPIAGSPLYDMSARFYAPSLGAFTQLDTVMGGAQNPLSMNRFLYAEANPATLIDPTGHAAVSQSQVCSSMADICGDTSTGNPNGGSQNKHVHTDGAPACSPNCAAKVTKTNTPPPAPQTVPTWLWSEYKTYLTSPEYLYRDRLVPPEIYASGAESAGAFLGWYATLFTSLAAPGATTAGMMAASNCGANDVACQIVAGTIAGGAYGLVKGGTKALASRLGTSLLGRFSESGSATAQAWSRLMTSRVARSLADDAACPLHSFSPATRVTTAAGAVAIAEIEVGDTVTARDPATGSVAEHTVSAVLVHTDQEIEYLRIDGETIETTPDHRFLTETGWVEAAALYPGTKVVKLDGSTGTVDGYASEVRPVRMWDLTVSDVHTFAVGEGPFAHR